MCALVVSHGLKSSCFIVCLHADAFRLYAGGVFSGASATESCSSAPTHALLLVGYEDRGPGTYGGGDNSSYWIAKNSCECSE